MDIEFDPPQVRAQERAWEHQGIDNNMMVMHQTSIVRHTPNDPVLGLVPDGDAGSNRKSSRVVTNNWIGFMCRVLENVQTRNR